MNYVDRDVNQIYYQKGVAFLKELYRPGSTLSEYIARLDSSPLVPLGTTAPRVCSEVFQCQTPRLKS